MKITLAINIFLLCVISIYGQNEQPTFVSSIRISEETSEVFVKTSIYWSLAKNTTFDSIPLVLPIEALIHERSFFRNELLSDQKIKIHFAKNNQITHIKELGVWVDSNPVLWNHDITHPEVIWIQPHEHFSGSFEIIIHSTIHLGDASLFPSGWLEGKVLLQHILPYAPPIQNNKWQITALNSRGNYFRQKHKHQLNIRVPTGWGLVANGNVKEENDIFNVEVFQKEVFILAGKNVAWDAHSKQGGAWLSYTWNSFYPAALFLESMRENLNDYGKKIGLEINNQDFFAVSLPYTPEYIDFGNGVFLLPEEKNPVGINIKYFANKIKSFTSKQALFAQIYFSTYLKTTKELNFFDYPWAGDGLARFLRDDFLESIPNPPVLSGNLEGSMLSRIMLIDQHPLSYQNNLLYYFLARQGLDQPIASSTADFTPLNYQSILQAKTSIALQHLKAFLKPAVFYQGIESILQAPDSLVPDSTWAQAFRQRKPTDWFFENYWYSNRTTDYRITNIAKCNSIYAVTVKNHGSAAVPFPITGYKEGEEFITIWYPGHEGKRSLGFHHDSYDYVSVDGDMVTQDLNPRNNSRKESGFLAGRKPLRFQFYTGVEDPHKEQVFFTPSGGFNIYDGLHGGFALFNSTIIPKKYEYRFEPNLSTGIADFENPFSGGLWRITGRASFVHNHRPESGPFHRVTSGFFGSSFHYDDNLRFFRYSPFVRFWWRKSHPRNNHIHRSRIRFLALERQQAVEISSSYRLLQFTHDYENISILRPCSLQAKTEISENFVKVQAEFDQRWMLPNSKWMSVRAFTGAFAYNSIGDQTDFFNFGLSGTQDYAFDYFLFGRSETSGFWSQQLLVTDGGFKTGSDVFASSWMSAVNTYIPLLGPLGVFGDIGWADDFNQTYWGYGIRLAFLTDFLEVYFPIQNQDRYLWENAYPREIRFIANFDINTIIQRVRRGLY
jgi:hypothetical protein